ncbi:lactaldehyde dehydrogenase [Klebsiella pneumoniae]|nr:lactaldehyde dehydrogenase [Klebsiella pneumoniae]
MCNAILLPIIENFNRPNAVSRFARVAQAMDVDTRGMSDEAASMEAINAIRALSKRVGIPQGFSQLGVSKADIEAGWTKRWPTRARRATRAPPAAMKFANSIWRPYDPQSFRYAGQPGRA